MHKYSERREITVLQTALVIDHGMAISTLDSVRLELGDGIVSTSAKHKSPSHSSFIGSLSKSIWTIMVEGAVEYCRIIDDLLPPCYKVIMNSNSNSKYFFQHKVD